MKNTFLLIISILALSFAHAQQADKDLRDGEILSLLENGGGLVYVSANKEQSLFIAGVYKQMPAPNLVIQHDGSDPGLVAALKYGRITQTLVTDKVTNILVSNENGDIKKGDFICISSTPGVGMKATKSGIIVGVAAEDFAPGAKGAGLVKARVMIQYLKM